MKSEKIQTMSPATTPRSIMTTTCFAQRMYVDPTDYIGQQILKNGAYEKDMLDAIHPILARLQPRTILDIGANIGNHTLAWGGKTAKIYAFEPGFNAYHLLKRNIEENRLEATCTPLNFGLSDTNTEATLYLNTSGNLGGSSLHVNTGTQESIRLRQGDSYLAKQGIRDIDFIKVDVEGHERQVFQGLKLTILRDRPVVQTEWNFHHLRGWVLDSDFMHAIFPDYEIYAFIKDTNRVYWQDRRGKIAGYLLRASIQLLQKLGRKKRIVFTRFDPIAHNTRVQDLLLVPREKRDVMADAQIWN